jgi:predicted RNA-binding protein YlxR (DUF448 family)
MPIGHERPMRTCVGCRVSSAQDDLLRLHLVAKDEGGCQVEPAINRRARATGLTHARHARHTGRSAYLCPRRSCLDQALKRRAFTRAFSSRSAGTESTTIMSIDSSAADALWTNAIAQVRREIELLNRSSALSSHPGSRAENPHAQPRRRGLERLLSELSSSSNPPVRPTPIDRRPRSNGQGGTPTHG